MRYIFQQSKIWEAGNPVDQDSKPLSVKVPHNSPEHRARRRLPPPGMGRIWLLVCVER
jgi:hypothetical protein